MAAATTRTGLVMERSLPHAGRPTGIAGRPTGIAGRPTPNRGTCRRTASRPGASAGARGDALVVPWKHDSYGRGTPGRVGGLAAVSASVRSAEADRASYCDGIGPGGDAELAVQAANL